MNLLELKDDIILERDHSVPMDDGVTLAANLFRLRRGEKRPVLISVTPYNKDRMPDRKNMCVMRLFGVRFGRLNASWWTSFEAPDPNFWVPNGYNVLQADIRGMHKSGGDMGVLTDRDARDYYQLIEWAATQSWCDGNVGLLGVSYLAMSQWRVAALRPPSLRAICPWEGATDLLREFAYQDGVPETGFLPIWWKRRMLAGLAPGATAESFLSEAQEQCLDGRFWASKRPALANVDAPALVAASWGDQGLHTRGSLNGFIEIGSGEKWLYAHGGRKWERFYSASGRDVQKAFFDHYLKGQPSAGILKKRVRLEVRRNRENLIVRHEDEWPPSAAFPVSLYLADSGKLTGQRPTCPKETRYRSRSLWRRPNSQAQFEFEFKDETQIVGTMRCRLWMSCAETDDLDIFVTVHKIGTDGKEVYFYGYNGFERDCVAKGWLRASHRELDPSRTTPLLPWHTHRTRQPIEPGNVGCLDVEILASATVFEPGERLRLCIQGGDAAHYPAFSHRNTVNRGKHIIHYGGDFDSSLTLPILPA